MPGAQGRGPSIGRWVRPIAGWMAGISWAHSKYSVGQRKETASHPIHPVAMTPWWRCAASVLLCSCLGDGLSIKGIGVRAGVSPEPALRPQIDRPAKTAGHRRTVSKSTLLHVRMGL